MNTVRKTSAVLACYMPPKIDSCFSPQENAANSTWYGEQKGKVERPNQGEKSWEN